MNELTVSQKIYEKHRPTIRLKVRDISVICSCASFFRNVEAWGQHVAEEAVFAGVVCVKEIEIERDIEDGIPVSGETSDGYHTFDELYEYRMLYNAHAAHGWLAAGIPVVKSWRHADGEECFGGGWFIVTATLPTGQVSNHYEAQNWDLFDVPEVELPPEWDGHTPSDAADRLQDMLQLNDSEVASETASEHMMISTLPKIGEPWCDGEPPKKSLRCRLGFHPSVCLQITGEGRFHFCNVCYRRVD